MRASLLSLTIALATLSARNAPAQTPPMAESRDGPVVLHNGVNEVPLLGDTTPGIIIVTWRGNYNGHGYSVVEFAVRNRSDLGEGGGLWQTVPFFGGPQDGDAGREIFRTGEGADCTLADLRVVRHRRAPVEVVVAARGLGKSFADPAPVRFDYYRIAHNDAQAPGWPPTYLRFVRSVTATREYCDVNRAFDAELRLTRVGLGHGERGG